MKQGACGFLFNSCWLIGVKLQEAAAIFLLNKAMHQNSLKR